MSAANPAYSWRARIEPEAIALILSIVVMALVVGAAISDTLMGDVPPPQPRPSAAPTTPPVAAPPAALVEQGIALNAVLVTSADRLEEIATDKDQKAVHIAEELRGTNVLLGNAKRWSEELAGYPDGSQVAGSLQIAYDVIRGQISETLRMSMVSGNTADYRRDATQVVQMLRGLAPFQGQLEALGG
jgi:hypothetical protein